MSKLELTDKQKEECQKVMDQMMQFFWSRITNKMLIENMTFGMAIKQVKLEILDDK